jgi:[protein-PII] uridylyltransferase
LNSEEYASIRLRGLRINNDASDFFTVIEVRSAATVGLLYELAKEFFSLDLNIRFAKFDSDEENMSGDFYVRDLLGQKIYDETRIEKIRQHIMQILK